VLIGERYPSLPSLGLDLVITSDGEGTSSTPEATFASCSFRFLSHQVRSSRQSAAISRSANISIGQFYFGRIWRASGRCGL
jgi:hypothetical protein